MADKADNDCSKLSYKIYNYFLTLMYFFTYFMYKVIVQLQYKIFSRLCCIKLGCSIFPIKKGQS